MKRVRVTASLCAFCAVALLAFALGCASSRHQETENLLSAAGFKTVTADTPRRQADLTNLPAHQITRTERDGQVYFVYPDPPNNLLYIGQQEQYNQYQRLRLQRQMAQDQLSAAQLNASYWGAWGPWGPWGGW
jgi:hypothetical protein